MSEESKSWSGEQGIFGLLLTAKGPSGRGHGSSANPIKSKTEDRHLGRTRPLEPLGAAVLYLKSCQA